MAKDNEVIVHGILKAYPGEYFTVTQIRRKILDDENTHMEIKTIVRCIDILKQLGVKIDERTERVGPNRKPLKVFSLARWQEYIL